jgi:hypothetical protein
MEEEDVISPNTCKILDYRFKVLYAARPILPVWTCTMAELEARLLG